MLFRSTSKSPPEKLTALVGQGHYGLKSGRGVYDWTQRDGQALLRARAEQLFRHLADDVAGA